VKLDPAQLQRCVNDQSEPEPFSGVIHLSQIGEALWSYACGHAIRSESVPNRIDTRFQIASGCKLFTAVAICQLVERGAFRFETRLKDCVEVEFPQFDRDITIHHLLTHSSGITSYFEEDVSPDYETLWQETPVYSLRSPRDFLPLFAHKPMKFAPGSRFQYNDGGYILLGLVVESVSDQPFVEFIAENVLVPAGMTDSGYFLSDRLPERTARGYIPNPDGTWRTNVFAVPIVGGPDGGAYTTARDMMKFWQALRENRLLSAESTRDLLRPQIAVSNEQPATHYGRGVWIQGSADHTRKFFAEGSDPGVAFKSAVYPESGVVLTVIGNTGRALWPLYRQLERLLDL
jgi:CubicO group peptidase (beta-lactamase class C family)